MIALREIEAIDARLGLFLQASRKMPLDLRNRGVRCYGEGDFQNRSAPFLGAPKAMRKSRKLTQSLTHTHK